MGRLNEISALPEQIPHIQDGELFASSLLGLYEGLVSNQVLAFRGRNENGKPEWLWTLSDTDHDFDAITFSVGDTSRTLRLAGRITMPEQGSQKFIPNFPEAGTENRKTISVDVGDYAHEIDVVILGDGQVFLPSGKEYVYEHMIRDLEI